MTNLRIIKDAKYETGLLLLLRLVCRSLLLLRSNDTPRRERLRVWLETELPAWFGARVLPIDEQVADRWGRLVAAAGRSLPAVDSLLAATALDNGLRLVTRNTSDFTYAGLDVVNPWIAS